jgi:uncharacterized protein YecE (DUF72 family)
MATTSGGNDSPKKGMVLRRVKQPHASTDVADVKTVDPEFLRKLKASQKPGSVWLAGTSGFNYKWWFSAKTGMTELDTFYPRNVSESSALQYYATKLKLVEINATFYSLPSKQSVQTWYSQTPADFRFLLKFSRFATHAKKLIDFAQYFGEFWDDRCDQLGDKCLGILIQLGPNFINSHRKSPIDKLTMLERVIAAGEHIKLRKREKGLSSSFKAFVEFRDPSWFNFEVYNALAAADLSLVCVNLNNVSRAFGNMHSGFNPTLEELSKMHDNINDCNKHIMFRCHGTSPQPYHGGYSDEDMLRMLSWIEAHSIKIAITTFDNTDSLEGEIMNVPSLTRGKQSLLIDERALKDGNKLLPHAISDSLKMQRIMDISLVIQ